MRRAPQAFAIVALGLASGCSTHRPNRVVAAIPQSVSQEIFLTERAGLQEAAEQQRLAVDWNGPSAPDPQRQIDLIAEAIHNQRYGIVVTPTGGAATDSVIEDALARATPVVILRDQTTLQASPHLSFVLEDYAAGARLITERLEQLKLSRGHVVLLGVDSFSENSVRRLDALETALRRDCPGLSVEPPVAAPFGNGYVQMATERALEHDSELVAFIALNARAGLATVAAIEEGQFKKKHVALLIYDPSLPLLLRMRRGEIDGIVSQNMRGMGQRAIGNLVADREERPYDHLVALAPRLLTKDNLNEQRSQDWLLFNPETP